MKLIREPDDVDLFVINKPFTEAEKREFSLLIQKLKWKRKLTAKKRRKPLTKKAVKR